MTRVEFFMVRRQQKVRTLSFRGKGVGVGAGMRGFEKQMPLTTRPRPAHEFHDNE